MQSASANVLLYMHHAVDYQTRRLSNLVSGFRAVQQGYVCSIAFMRLSCTLLSGAQHDNRESCRLSPLLQLVHGTSSRSCPCAALEWQLSRDVTNES